MKKELIHETQEGYCSIHHLKLSNTFEVPSRFGSVAVAGISAEPHDDYRVEPLLLLDRRDRPATFTARQPLRSSTSYLIETQEGTKNSVILQYDRFLSLKDSAFSLKIFRDPKLETAHNLQLPRRDESKARPLQLRLNSSSRLVRHFLLYTKYHPEAYIKSRKSYKYYLVSATS